jgi:serine/threonine protein kinase
MPKKGETLRTTFENFEIVSQINSGGAGEVYMARNSSGDPVAIKVLRFNPDSGKRKRFEREIRFCSQEIHPNIVSILDHGMYLDKSGERPFYVMRRYEGTLDDYLAENRSDEDKLRVFVSILDGVEAAHLRRITHRDIKPKNILISKDGSEVAVADFGIARFLEEQIQEAALTEPGDRLLNIEYAAPEQLTPGQVADERTDIFALGLLLYRIYTGAVPRGANPKQISSATTKHPYLDDIANLMIQDDRDKRPQSIDEVKRLLIQRGNDFVQQQKLDDLRQRVIPTSELSVDPLIGDPIRVIDRSWDNGQLVLILSQVPNPIWAKLLNDGRYNHGGIGGVNPAGVRFVGNEARIPIPQNMVNDYMVGAAYRNSLQWVSATNAEYAAHIARQRAQLRADEEQKRRNLREQIVRGEEELRAQERAREILARLPN